MVTALSIKVNEDGSKDFIFDDRIIEMFGNDKESLMKFVDVLEQKEVKLSQEETNKLKEKTKQMGFKNMENIIMAGCNTINLVDDRTNEEVEKDINKNFVWAKKEE